MLALPGGDWPPAAAAASVTMVRRSVLDDLGEEVRAAKFKTCILPAFACCLPVCKCHPCIRPQLAANCSNVRALALVHTIAPQVTGIVAPVSICMALTVVLVRILNGDGDSDSQVGNHGRARLLHYWPAT